MEIIHRDTDYALRVLVRLAAARPEQTLSVRFLAAETEVPEEYLRKIAQKLVAAGIVLSERGRFGGLRLGRDPKRIALLDVMDALDATPAINRCFMDQETCGRRDRCPLRPHLTELNAAVARLFRDATLAALVHP